MDSSWTQTLFERIDARLQRREIDHRCAGAVRICVGCNRFLRGGLLRCRRKAERIACRFFGGAEALCQSAQSIAAGGDRDIALPLIRVEFRVHRGNALIERGEGLLTVVEKKPHGIGAGKTGRGADQRHGEHGWQRKSTMGRWRGGRGRRMRFGNLAFGRCGFLGRACLAIRQFFIASEQFLHGEFHFGKRLWALGAGRLRRSPFCLAGLGVRQTDGLPFDHRLFAMQWRWCAERRGALRGRRFRFRIGLGMLIFVPGHFASSPLQYF